MTLIVPLRHFRVWECFVISVNVCVSVRVLKVNTLRLISTQVYSIRNSKRSGFLMLWIWTKATEPEDYTECLSFPVSEAVMSLAGFKECTHACANNCTHNTWLHTLRWSVSCGFSCRVLISSDPLIINLLINWCLPKTSLGTFCKGGTGRSCASND